MNQAKTSNKFGRITPEVLGEIKTEGGEKKVYTNRDDLESYSYDMTGKIFAQDFEVLRKSE